MFNKIGFRRSGDVNLHEISKEFFEKITGRTIEHNGSYVLAEGEATNSKHIIEVQKKENMIIKEDDLKYVYIAILEEAKISHNHDHETIIAPKETYYVQVPEREINWFAEGIQRIVVD